MTQGLVKGFVLASLVGQLPSVVIFALMGAPYHAALSLCVWLFAAACYRQRTWEVF